MAKKTFIQLSEIQAGDLIKVKYTLGSLKVSREGIAYYQDYGMWRTADDYVLGPPAEGLTSIELVDRPVPIHELPTGEHAVISYYRLDPQTEGQKGGQRYATLVGGEWHMTNGAGRYCYTPQMDDAEMVAHVNNASKVSDFAVLFAGVTN